MIYKIQVSSTPSSTIVRMQIFWIQLDGNVLCCFFSRQGSRGMIMFMMMTMMMLMIMFMMMTMMIPRMTLMMMMPRM